MNRLGNEFNSEGQPHQPLDVINVQPDPEQTEGTSIEKSTELIEEVAKEQELLEKQATSFNCEVDALISDPSEADSLSEQEFKSAIYDLVHKYDVAKTSFIYFVGIGSVSLSALLVGMDAAIATAKWIATIYAMTTGVEKLHVWLKSHKYRESVPEALKSLPRGIFELEKAAEQFEYERKQQTIQSGQTRP